MIGPSVAAAEAALWRVDRLSRFVRIVTLVGVLAVLAVTILFGSLLFARENATAVRARTLGVENHEILQAVQAATGPGEQARTATQLKQLVGCLYLRVDFDTGRVRSFPASCRP